MIKLFEHIYSSYFKQIRMKNIALNAFYMYVVKE